MSAVKEAGPAPAAGGEISQQNNDSGTPPVEEKKKKREYKDFSEEKKGATRESFVSGALCVAHLHIGLGFLGSNMASFEFRLTLSLAPSS